MIKRRPGIIFISVGVILLLRLIFIGLMGLMPQDAYYDFYGEHLALSYYDHPPAIAYILRLFTEIFGKKVFALKLADSIVSFLSLLFFYRLSLLFLGKQGAQKSVLLFFSTLILTILSLISTPDTPLVLFWTISLLSLYHAIFLGKNIWWIWSGIFIGLSFDSKYTAIFLLFGLFVFLLASNKYRRLLLSPWPWLCLFFFLVTILPVIIWNVQNDFASFRFQSQNRMKSMSGIHIDLLNFAGVIGHQSAILVPVLFFSLIYYLFRLFKKYRLKIYKIPDEKLFLLCFFLPVFIGFLCLSFIYWVKLNWMIPAYISAIIWLSVYIGKRWIRYQLIFSMIVHFVLAIEVIFYPVDIKSDDTWAGWPDLANSVRELKKDHPGNFIFSADDYKTSAVLNFYLDEMVYSQNIIGRRALQFDFVGSDLNALKGKNALFIDSDPSFSDQGDNPPLPPEIFHYFDSVKPLNPILMKKYGRTIRKFLVYECENYHPKE